MLRVPALKPAGWSWICWSGLLLSGCSAEPAPSALAELQVHFDSKSDSPVETLARYRETQGRLLVSPFVLHTALKDPKVASLGVVKEQAKPLEWLEKNLKVEYPADEFIRISFTGPATAESAQIVNAVTNAYLEEVANSDEKHRRERLVELRAAQTKLRDDLRTNRGKLRRLTAPIAEGVDPEGQLSPEQFAELARQLVLLKIEHERHLAENHLAQRRVDAADVDESDERVREEIDDDPLVVSCRARLRTIADELVGEPLADAEAQSRRIERLNAELARIEQLSNDRCEKLEPMALSRVRAAESRHRRAELARQSAAIEAEKSLLASLEKAVGDARTKQKTSLQPLDLLDLKGEIARVEKIEDEISDEILKLELSGKAQSKVELFRKADAPEPSLDSLVEGNR